MCEHPLVVCEGEIGVLAELQRFENAGVFGAVIYVELFGNVIQIHKKKGP